MSSFIHFELKSHAVNIFNLDAVVEAQVFAQPGDEHVEAAAQEVIVLAPDGFEDKGTFYHLVAVFVEEFEQVGFFLGKRFGIAFCDKAEVFIVERVIADADGSAGFQDVGVLGAAQENINFQQQFLDAERFGDVVVGADGQAVNFVLFHTFGRQENDRHHFIPLSYLLCQREAVHFRQHHIENAQVEFLGGTNDVEGFLSVFAIGDFVAVEFEVVAGNEAQALVVFHV